MTEVRRVAVTSSGAAVNNLNELEYVRCGGGGKAVVLANRWYDNNIYVIDPEDGKVVVVWDFADLRARAANTSPSGNGKFQV